MKKSELRKIIREEIKSMMKSKKPLTEGMREDLMAQRKLFSDYELLRAAKTSTRFTVKEATTLKKGGKVKDYMGHSYTVIDFGPWQKVAKYDSTGAGVEAYKMFGKSATYVATKSSDGETLVWTHGDEGVE